MTQASGHDARGRLLRHLREAGAFALASPLGCGRIALYRSSGSTSLGAGYVSAEAAEALLAEGLVIWSGADRARRLVLAAASPGRPLAETVVVVDGTAQQVPFDERESPLLWLHRRRGKDGKPQISQEEFAAGERFRADLTRARMLPRTTMNWDAALTPEERGPGGRDPAGASDVALAARQRVRQACERLGPELSGIAIDVCGFLKGLDQVERERRWPARSAKVVLRLALAALSTHYGIAAPASSPRRGRVWRAGDARPRIMPAAAEP